MTLFYFCCYLFKIEETAMANKDDDVVGLADKESATSRSVADKGKELEPNWKEAAVIADKVDVQEHFALNVIKLLDSGATIPFIARYRKEQTGDMPVDKLRECSVLLVELR